MSDRSFRRHLGAGTLACLLLGALGACEPKPPAKGAPVFTGPTMGTSYHVTVPGAQGQADARTVRRCIDDVLARVNARLSTYTDRSEISALNRNSSTDWVPVSSTVFAVLAAAHRVSVETEGAFDVTVAPLVRLWGFGPQGAKDPAAEARPTPEFVHDATAISGYSWLELRTEPGLAVRKNRTPIELDVNGIAPGYAVDRVSSCLRRAGFADHLVEIGSERRAMGERIEDAPWQVAIERPLAGERAIYARIRVSDAAVSTSGAYRDVRRLPDGRTVSHMIDPRVGEPVRHALASVTVVHPRAQLADAYATALLVLGPEEGLAAAQRLGLPALFLERIGQSEEFRGRETQGFTQLRERPR